VLKAREKNFQIYGVPLLSLVAFLTIVPTLLNRSVTSRRTSRCSSSRRACCGKGWTRAVNSGVARWKHKPAGDSVRDGAMTFLTDHLAFTAWTTVRALALLFSL
jgi:hypothetical protein